MPLKCIWMTPPLPIDGGRREDRAGWPHTIERESPVGSFGRNLLLSEDRAGEMSGYVCFFGGATPGELAHICSFRHASRITA